MLQFQLKANFLMKLGNDQVRKPLKIRLLVKNFVNDLIRLRGSNSRLKKIKSKIFNKIKHIKESKDSCIKNKHLHFINKHQLIVQPQAKIPPS